MEIANSYACHDGRFMTNDTPVGIVIMRTSIGLAVNGVAQINDEHTDDKSEPRQTTN